MLKMSKHATKRCQQRGVTDEMVATILTHADREAHCGDGCTALEISRNCIHGIGSGTGVAPERLHGLIIVLNNAGAVVTVVRTRGRSASRRYRRGLN